MFSWFDTSEATGVGVALADDIASTATVRMRRGTTQKHDAKELQKFLRRVDGNAGSLRLNLFKRAKLASAFKLKLLESGVDTELADELTHMVLMQLSLAPTQRMRIDRTKPSGSVRSETRTAEHLLAEGQSSLSQRQFRAALSAFQRVIELIPTHAEAMNGLGSALWELGAYREAEQHFREATRVRSDYPEALCNLGAARMARGELEKAESVFRRAIKLKPAFVDAQSNLGHLELVRGRLAGAEALFLKVLRSAPRHVNALLGMAKLARLHGRFDEAQKFLRRALEIKPGMPLAWAALTTIRRMDASDSEWLQGAKEILSRGVAPLDEIDLQFAMGKYFDDLHDYEHAFQSYQRANELQRTFAPKYERAAHTAAIDNLIHAYSRQALSRPSKGSSSTKPVFVVGMMRSGTSLVEQIIATHPRAAGAGELSFWNDVFLHHAPQLGHEALSNSSREGLAARYLQMLDGYGKQAQVVVDKANVNSDYLGMIHTVFPSARFIYVQRHPIDTCLSCYFQPLSPAHSFRADLSDLAHYYGEHQRVMNHWRSVLPSGSLLEVPYEGLVAQQEQWTRKILNFLGLDWQPECLNFHRTHRPVVTASAWQVRQKMYDSSIGRWRHYESYLGPLRSLI